MEDAARAEQRQGLLIAAILFVVALGARVVLPPWTHYTYNDEYYYLRYAYDLRTTGTAALENQPPFLTWLYALAFLVLPTTAHTTSAISAFVGSLTVPALYGCLRALAVDRVVSGLAALLLALHPLHLKHSGATSLEVVSLFWIVATIGTFARWRSRPSIGSALVLGGCLFGALTTRIENFALLPILGALAIFSPQADRRPALMQVLFLALVVGVAASYLPRILSFHGNQADWWVSELAPLTLLANNLAFWIGGSLTVGKVPFLLIAAGLVGAWRSNRVAGLTWIAILLTYSTIYVIHGVNLGYHEESTQHPFLAARAGGHDMFRFNVILLPAMAFFTASGVVAWLQLIDTTLTRLPDRARTPTAVAILLVAGTLLLSWGDAHRAFDPAGFLASPYNRTIEQTEYELLERHLRDAPRPTRCYALPSPTEPFLGPGIDILPIERPDEVSIGEGSAFLLISSVQLAKPDLRKRADAVLARFDVEPIAAATAGPVEYRLVRLRPKPRH